MSDFKAMVRLLRRMGSDGAGANGAKPRARRGEGRKRQPRPMPFADWTARPDLDAGFWRGWEGRANNRPVVVVDERRGPDMHVEEPALCVGRFVAEPAPAFPAWSLRGVARGHTRGHSGLMLITGPGRAEYGQHTVGIAANREARAMRDLRAQTGACEVVGRRLMKSSRDPRILPPGSGRKVSVYTLTLRARAAARHDRALDNREVTKLARKLGPKMPVDERMRKARASRAANQDAKKLADLMGRLAVA